MSYRDHRVRRLILGDLNNKTYLYVACSSININRFLPIHLLVAPLTPPRASSCPFYFPTSLSVYIFLSLPSSISIYVCFFLPLSSSLFISLSLTLLFSLSLSPSSTSSYPFIHHYSPPSPSTSSHSFHQPLPIPLPLVTPLILLLFLLTPLFKYPFSIIYRNCMHRQCTVQRDNKNVI